MMRTTLRACAALLCSAVPLYAGDASLEKEIEAYLAPLVAARDFSGVVLVAKADQVLVEKAYGMADFETSTPLTTRSSFRVASITKAFTAAAISILAEQEKLAYTDPLSKYIANFPRGDEIQLRHLLLHTSGVGNPDSAPCSDAALDTLIQELARTPLAFEPGTRSRYSNGGYALLARVIEKASGKPWDEYLRAAIFEPLKLTAAAAERRGSTPDALARGHVPGPGPIGLVHPECDGAWAAIGGGALIASALDLHRFGTAVRDDKLFARTKLEHPYGWGVREYHGRRAIEQSGILPGFASYLAVYLDEPLTVVVLSNVQSGALTEIGKGLAALALGVEAPKLAPSPPTVAATAEERARWIGRFACAEVAPIEILERGGWLYLRWGNSQDLVFVTPTGPAKAHDRQDSIAMELVGADDKVIRMRWPDGSTHEFVRLP